MRKSDGKHTCPKSKSKSPVHKVLVCMLIILVCIIQLYSMKNILSFFTYEYFLSNTFKIDNDYIIIYDANGGSGTMANQTMYYTKAEHLTPNTYTNGTLNFLKWNTRSDGNGIDYADEEEVVGLVSQNHGTITSNAAYAAVDNNHTGTLYVTGGQIIATGDRQAIYNSKGYVEISGSAYLSSTTGIRATVQNIELSTMVIKGGTIVSVNQQGVDNAGTLTIGTSDGSIDTTTPTIQGHTYGVTTSDEFYFYDGTLKGISGTVSGTITGIEANSSQAYGTETIGTDTYQKRI